MSNPFTPAAPGTSLLEQMQRTNGLAPAAPPAAPVAPVADGDMYNLWPKDARGVPTSDSMGRPLPPELIERIAQTGSVPNPENPNSYVPIRPLNQHVVAYLNHYANQYANKPPAAPPAPAQGWAPNGMLPPPAAPAAMFAPPPAFTPPTMAINPPESALPPAPPTGLAALPTAPAAPAAEATKRKRRTKAEMEAARASGGTMNVTGAVFNNSDPNAKVGTAPGPDRSPIEVLCVGCRPSGGAFKVIDLARDILPVVTAQIKKDLNVDDYAAMDFGKGSAALALYGERAVIAACEDTDDDVCLVVDRSTREASVILSKLYPLANVVIHGS